MKINYKLNEKVLIRELKPGEALFCTKEEDVDFVVDLITKKHPFIYNKEDIDFWKKKVILNKGIWLIFRNRNEIKPIGWVQKGSDYLKEENIKCYKSKYI